MKQKKESINLSLCIIIVASILSAITYFLKYKCQVCDFLFALFVGITGSACATLFIFIHDYKDEKKKLMDKICHDGFSLYRRIRDLKFNFPVSHIDESAILGNFKNRNYQNPKDVLVATSFDQLFYELCCFVDRALEIDLTEVYGYIDLIGQIDYWSDSLRKSYDGDSKKNIAYKALAMPLSNALIGKCEAERDGIYSLFHEFKEGRISASTVYDAAIALNRNINLKPINESPNFAWYLYTTLYAFQAAYVEEDYNNSEKKEAFESLKNGSEYRHVR